MGLLRCNSYKVTRSKYVSVWLWVVGVSSVLNLAECSLPLRKPCGDVECQALEYCRQADHQCQPCKEICDRGSNNFDVDRCVSDCQDHIHDERYLKLENSTLLELQRSEFEHKYKDLEQDVLILKIVVSVCVAVIAVVVAALLSFLVYFWKLMHPPTNVVETPEQKKKNGINPKRDATVVELPTVYNNRYGVNTPTPETSPASVMSISPSDTTITMMTTSTKTSAPPYTAGIQNSPAKSESSIATPGTATTTLNSSASTLTSSNGGCGPGIGGRLGSAPAPNSNRFRREPIESTLPDNCAYDNLSMSPQHCHYSHHV